MMKKTIQSKLPLMLIPEAMRDVRLSNGSKGGLCTDSEWDKLRKWAWFDSGGVCTVCGHSGGPDFLSPVGGGLECHEEWSWDTKRGIQKLERIRMLCTSCHRTAHILDTRYHYGSQAFEFCIEWLKQVNGWDTNTVHVYLRQEQLACDLRQGFYEVDVSLKDVLLKAPSPWPTKGT
jgi:hypothetical protein